MTPVSIETISREWADKILAGRVPFSTELVLMPELQDGYLEQQAALIESQAKIAAAAWARRHNMDPEAAPAHVPAKIAEHIAVQIAMATAAHAKADTTIAARLHVSGESPDS